MVTQTNKTIAALRQKLDVILVVTAAMVKILGSKRATKEEKEAALDTLKEMVRLEKGGKI